METIREYLVPDADCARSGAWVYVTEDDPRYQRALKGGHVDRSVYRDRPAPLHIELWDADYRKWSVHAEPRYGKVEVYSTAHGEDTDKPFAWHVWLRESIIGVAYTPETQEVRLTVPGGIYDDGDMAISVDFRTTRDAELFYRSVRRVMWGEES